MESESLPRSSASCSHTTCSTAKFGRPGKGNAHAGLQHFLPSGRQELHLSTFAPVTSRRVLEAASKCFISTAATSFQMR